MKQSPTSQAESPALQSYRQDFQRLERQLNGLKGSFFHEHRSAAMEAFERMGFPNRRNEDWKYTPTGAMTRETLRPAEFPDGDSSPNGLGQLSTLIANRLVFINGSYLPSASEIIDTGAFEIGSLKEAIHADPDRIATWFDGLQNSGASAFARLNSAMYQDGAWIWAKPGAQVEHPILIIDVCQNMEADQVAYPRHLIVAEAGSSLSIIHVQSNFAQEHAPADQVLYRGFAVAEVFVQRDARVSLDMLQEGEADYQLIHHVDVRLDQNSHFRSRTFSLAGKLIRNNLTVRFGGEHAECDVQGVYLAAEQDLIDNHLYIDHAHPNCLSNQLYKGLASGKGTAVFNGIIYVRPNAQKTNAYQSNKNLLLSDQATINTKPQLEIFADDVRCSHGATSGQLDPESIFYLKARGIPQAEATRLLLEAFSAEVISSLDSESFRAIVQSRFNARVNQAIADSSAAWVNSSPSS